jgi:hypothetical protein
VDEFLLAKSGALLVESRADSRGGQGGPWLHLNFFTLIPRFRYTPKQTNFCIVSVDKSNEN